MLRLKHSNFYQMTLEGVVFLYVGDSRCTLREKLTSPKSISAFEPEHTEYKTEQCLSEPELVAVQLEEVLAVSKPEQAKTGPNLGRWLSQIWATCQVVEKQFCVDLKRQKARIYSPWKGGVLPCSPLLQIWKDVTSPTR
jgi:hypothetical protein